MEKKSGEFQLHILGKQNIFICQTHEGKAGGEGVWGGGNVVKKMKRGDGCVKSVGGEAVMSKR